MRLCLRGYGIEEGCNGEEGQEDFEDRATRVILAGRLDVASDDMGSRYLIKKRSLSVGERRRNAKKGEYEDFRLPKEICLDFFS